MEIQNQPTTESDTETEVKPLMSGVGHRFSKKPTNIPATPKPQARTSNGIGRGGVSAIIVLVVFLPLVGGLAYLWLDTVNQLESMRANLQAFQRAANDEQDGQFFALLGEPGLQVTPLKAEDGNPTGRMTLYTAGRLQWAFSYGKIEALGKNETYVAWVHHKPVGTQPALYEKLVVLPDVRTGGAAVVVPQEAFPNSFDKIQYSEVVVTVEPLDQVVNQPTGPRRFSADLTATH